MNIRAYLPSGQFSLLAVSIVLAGGLVVAAEYFTAPQTPATLSVDTSQPAQDPNWAATLQQIEASSASSPFAAANPGAAQALLSAAQNGNITDSVGRSVLINLANAKSQGLGDDIPTQDSIIAAAAAQVAQSQASTSAYALSDLDVVPASNAALHTYGNAVIEALDAHEDASEQTTFLAIDAIVEGGIQDQTHTLAGVGAAYKAIALSLLNTPVPQTLAPLHLQAINDFLQIAATYDDMEAVGTDPLRGVAGLQNYESLMNANAGVFTNIAQELNKDGILFTKDEPGSAWSAFVSPT